MRFSRPTLVALVLVALAAGPVAAARPAAADAARAEHERILRFWTPERMAAAKPRDFTRSGAGFVPANNGKGKPGGGGGGDSSTVTGASWTKGGAVADSVGKVFFTMGSSTYQCSGSAAGDSRSNYSLVLTAGHCAYDETSGAFATNWMFIPAWGSSSTSYKADCTTYTTTKYGCWTATALVVHEGYATAGGFNQQATVHDFAFAVVGAGGHSGSAQLDQTVTAFSLDIDSVALGTQVYAFGYPAGQKYKGNTLSYCAGKTTEDSWNDNLTWGLGCDMTGGSSGGPWLANFNTTTGVGVLGSLNSYGYSGVKNMYGPKFNSKTSAVHASADSATSNTIVGP